jgi:predicted Zn-dependent protease
MSNPMITNLEKLLAGGRDDALLRFGLGKAYLDDDQAGAAVTHLERAVEHDPGYSAAWKLLGRALADDGRPQEAISVYERGIAAAEAKGDKQAGKEMQVFLKRLQKTAAGDPR